jgi:hypothetical protein
MSYSALFEPNYVFEDANVEKFARLTTTVTKKQISGGSGPAAKALFLRFGLQGQVLAFYEGAPKIETPPFYIVSAKDVQEVKETTIEKEEVVYLKIVDEEISLKFDKPADKKDWVAAINAVKKFFGRRGGGQGSKEMKDSVTPYLEAQLQSELESANFKTLSKYFEYGNFCRDKGYKSLLDIDMKLLKNRLVICQCKFDGRMLPAELVDKKRMSSMRKTNANQMPILNNAGKPITDDQLYGKNFYMVLICQKPGSYINQATMSTDYDIMQPEVLPSSLQFHTVFFYTYESTGDITECKKILSAASDN